MTQVARPREKIRKKNILLLEHDPMVLAALTRLLSYEDFIVLAARNSRQLLRRHAESRIDIALLNLSPNDELSGWGTFNRLAHQRPSLPIVIMSAHAELLSVPDSAPSHPQAIFAKPMLDVGFFCQTLRDLSVWRTGGTLRPQLEQITGELMNSLARQPELMRELSPRKFEEAIAEILSDQGHTVQLTPATRDGGRDIIVVMKTCLADLLIVIECKRWSPPQKVGISVVERFLHVLREKSRANLGIIATTTYFSKDAIRCAEQYKYQLKLADFDHLREMVKRYGSWRRTKESEIWVPTY